MTSKSEIRHGALFAIPLWNNIGFFYGKMVFGSHLKNDSGRKRNAFIEVYDFYTEKYERDFELNFFKGKDLFVDPFILAGFPKLKGNNSWKFLRHDPTYEEDEFIHHYLQVDYFDSTITDANKKFWVVKFGNLNNPNNEFLPYYRVKHLPVHRHKNDDAISIYLTFDWLKRNGKDVDEPFEYKNGLDEKKSIRYEVMKMAVDYRTIPKEIRGRVAPEGYEWL